MALSLQSRTMADQVTPPSLDGYLRSLNRAEDLVLKAMYEEACADNVPVVGPEVGALLQVLVMATRATRVLEIGAAMGYSGVWLARTLPADGLLLTIEIDPARASLARENFKRAGVAERANVIVGDAMRFVAKVGGPFDLIFNDTDKQLYGALHDRLVDLLRPGGLLVVDDTLL
jgi:predicted O-methyltransferase YrrM